MRRYIRKRHTPILYELAFKGWGGVRGNGRRETTVDMSRKETADRVARC